MASRSPASWRWRRGAVLSPNWGASAAVTQGGGEGGWGGADAGLDLGEELAGELEGAVAGEQFAGDDAEGVEVAGGGDGEAADLLGAGVVGGEGVEPALGGGELLGPLALAQEAGDAEVEEFDGAVGWRRGCCRA